MLPVLLLFVKKLIRMVSLAMARPVNKMLGLL